MTAPNKSFTEEPRNITISTFAPCTTSASKNEIDTKSLSSSELKSLKNDDPFMYYSIPHVREAEFRLEEVDISKINQSSTKCSRIFLPLRRPRENQDDANPSKTVKRCSRISFECHADMAMDETLAKTGEGYAQEESFDVDFDAIMNCVASTWGNERPEA